MARTNINAVQSLLGANYGKLPESLGGSLPDLQQWIDLATTTVDEVVRQAALRKPQYSHTVAQLELIERCVACLNYCRMDPIYTTRSTMGASGGFASGHIGTQAEAERYKQLAIEQDPSGCLNAILNRNVARVQAHSHRKWRRCWGGRGGI